MTLQNVEKVKGAADKNGEKQYQWPRPKRSFTRTVNVTVFVSGTYRRYM